MAITQAQAETQLAAWLAASEAVAKGQSYRMGESVLTRADAEQVRRMLEYWDAKVEKLARNGLRVRRAVPLG